jgi:hypothetical protein
LFGLKVVSRLYDLVRDPGKDPCGRARNYLATKELFNLALTLSNPLSCRMLGAYAPPVSGGDRRKMEINLREFPNVTVDDLECKPARCVRYGTELYEVELLFYNFANQFMGSAADCRCERRRPCCYGKTACFPEEVLTTMKLPTYFSMRQWQAGATRSYERGNRGDDSLSQIEPAQQGVGECQDYCEAMYPDSPIEQLECYKRECWS